MIKDAHVIPLALSLRACEFSLPFRVPGVNANALIREPGIVGYGERSKE